MSKHICVVLPQGLHDLILRKASSFPEETGGAIIGYRLQRRDDGSKVWLLRTFLPPGPAATHSSCSFSQGGLYQAALLSLLRRLEKWPKSKLWRGQGPFFLGDWHSHPSFSNEPSQGDRETVHKLLDEETKLPAMLVMIAANGKGQKWTLGTHLALRQGDEITWQEAKVRTPKELGLHEELAKIAPWPSPQRLTRILRKFKERRANGQVN